ncbi:hypothetical protein K491DRAFT_772574 [Lophiostoma macrostomum CBS 122681]|uniref:DUF676 domain-containing protein n=1 Tax=Lophiostoma macrostomum CBS 122681 TaxID=1314788 RepID=A0A6A6SJL4_9PLEO|nr:hypothetical protein K491DRAFT_772574 [Lophiostoma macrostomum CBS 122681]
MAPTKGPVFRVTGLPASQPDAELTALLEAAIHNSLTEEERSKQTVSIATAPSCYDDDEKVALVEFHGGAPAFLSELKDNPLGDWQVEMGDTDLSFDCHFFGFTQLYTQMPSMPVTADIIAITGLDGHAYGSWRGKGNLGRMWLRDFLSKDLPHCRTMIYGYNSKLSSRGVDTIMDYGWGLIEELKKVRHTEELRKRPLFFIAHSFGGIILAHCLVKAVQTNEDDHPTIASLHKATYGMLLFGIPHKGLLVDDIQKMLAGQDNHPRSMLLQQIRSKSDLLANQLVDFKNLIRDRKIASFYETGQTRQLEFDRESKRWKRTGDFVTAVDADSALLQLPEHMEEKIPLDADHSMIVKFDTRNTRGYTSARDKLRQFEQDAPRVVADRFFRPLIPRGLRRLTAVDDEVGDVGKVRAPLNLTPLSTIHIEVGSGELLAYELNDRYYIYIEDQRLCPKTKSLLLPSEAIKLGLVTSAAGSLVGSSVTSGMRCQPAGRENQGVEG